MSALSEKTVLLVTHQVDFLPIFDSILVGISLALALSLPLSLMFYVQLWFILFFFVVSCIFFQFDLKLVIIFGS
jgi:hypothetical protein